MAVPWSILVVLAVASGPAPERVALLPATGTNVTDGLLAAAQDVLRGHLERTGRFEVALTPGVPGARPEPAADEVARAVQGSGVRRALALRISRLGASAHVRLAAYDAAGRLVRSDELPAASPDDLDPVLARLARGLADDRLASDEAEIDSVTEREADAYLKYTATHVFGLALGGLYPIQRPVNRSDGPVPGVAVFWLYDARTLLAEITFGLYDGNDRHLVSVGLGAYRPLSRGNLTPYLGGGLRYAWSGLYSGSTANGLQANATLGVLFGRLSTVQLRAEAGYFVNLFREGSNYYQLLPDGTYGTGSTERVVSHGPTLSVGIGF
jgi:hypothetical protein